VILEIQLHVPEKSTQTVQNESFEDDRKHLIS